jgi:hypothetical protein
VKENEGEKQRDTSLRTAFFSFLNSCCGLFYTAVSISVHTALRGTMICQKLNGKVLWIVGYFTTLAIRIWTI